MCGFVGDILSGAGDVISSVVEGVGNVVGDAAQFVADNPIVLGLAAGALTGGLGLLGEAGALGADAGVIGGEGLAAEMGFSTAAGGPGILESALAGGGAGGLSAADTLGLTQMGQAAGLSGAELDAFVNSGGVMGSTAAGGGGIGTGAIGQDTGWFDPNAGSTQVDPTTGLPSNPTNLPTDPNAPTNPGPNSGPPTDRNPDGSRVSDNPQLPSGDWTSKDWLNLAGTLGKGLPGLLGAYGANQSANSLSDLANKYFDIGGPSRARYEGSYAPGFTMANDPGYTDAMDQASKANLHALSVTGNPFGNPGGQLQNMQDLYQKTAYPALQGYRTTNATTGGMGTFAAAAPGAATNAIQQQGNVMSSLGGAADYVFNPKSSFEDLMKMLKNYGGTYTPA